MKSKISAKELMDSWKKALAFWGYPAIEAEHYTSKSAAKKSMGDDIAHFDFAMQRARINIPKLEERLGIDCLEAVDKHEIGHYTFCPFDLKNCILMIQGAQAVVQDYKKAMYIENVVADIMLNTHMVNKGDSSISTVYQRMGKTDDALWTLIMRSCELLWKIPSQTLAKRNKEVENDAHQIAQIIGHSMYVPAQWQSATAQCAQLLSKYELNPNDKSREVDSHKPSDFVAGTDMYSMAKSLAGISKNLSHGDFTAIAAGTEMCTKEKAAQLYHIDVARQYAIQPPTAILPLHSDSMASPREWSAEDDVEKLDIAYSLQQGILIPGDTTYRWHADDNPTIPTKSYRDLFIVLDSSASMPDPSEGLSVPVVSSLALSRSAHQRGSRVAAISFSHGWKSCEYTHHDKETDEILLSYLNGGTIIPAQAIRDITKSHHYPQHIVIITDAAIGNLEQDKELLAEARSYAQGGTIFLYGTTLSTTHSTLESIGYTIRPATTEKDLLHLSTQLSADLYGRE